MSGKKRRREKSKDIAIIGMACRFPGAGGYKRFWDNLERGVSSIREIPSERWNSAGEEPGKGGANWCGALDNIDLFDNRFFNVSPREAAGMDPQQRLLLEEAWHCIEDAGVPLGILREKKTSVFTGVTGNDYSLLALTAKEGIDGYAALGNFECMLANRISHVFGFSGVSISMDAACASSLVALHEAKQSLASGESDYAVAAGVCLAFHPWRYAAFSKSNMMSPDGCCRAFDKDADGFVQGEGAGVLLLQRLEEAAASGCHIYGVIKGSAVNHTAHTQTVTAPKVSAQREVILAAYEDAGFSPETVSYVEAHGTGTSLGDPIEIEALTQAFREYTGRNGFCKIGSVKTNIGHLASAAGIAGVIKVLLMMQHEKIPATLNLNALNPLLDWESTPFTAAEGLNGWEGHPLRAGVSAFGFGGVNCHVLLEKFEGDNRMQTCSSADACFFALSAKTPQSLEKLAETWRSFADSDVFSQYSIRDICLTLLTGRQAFSCRCGGRISSREEIKGLLAPVRSQDIKAGHGWCLSIGGQEPGPEIYTHISKLMNLGFSPQLVMGEGKGIWTALAVCGMIKPEELLSVLDGKKSPEQVELSRPSIPFYDPVSRQTIEPFHFDEEYVRFVSSEPDIPDEALDYLVHKARTLYTSQLTFKKCLEEWEHAAKEAAGHGVLEMLYKDALKPGEKCLLAAVITSSLQKVNRKWDLTGQEKTEEPRFCELMDLVADGVMQKETLAELLTGDSPDYAAAAESLNNNRSRMDRRKAYKYIKKRNENIRAIKEFPAWLREAVSIRDVSPCDGEWKVFRFDASTLGFEEALMELWLQGIDIQWGKLYPEGTFKKVPLPVYEFEGESFWLPSNPSGSPETVKLHPFVDRNTSTLEEQKFTTRLTGNEYCLAEHVIAGRKVLQGVFCVEMARAAGEFSRGKRVQKIKNIVWARPVEIAGGPCEIHVSLYPDGDTVDFEIWTMEEAGARTVHAQGKLLYGGDAVGSSSHEFLDIEAAKRRCPESRSGDEYYDLFRSMGVNHGPAFQSVLEAYYSENEALGKLRLPEAHGRDSGELVLHPAILDGAFQVAMGMLGTDRIYLPFAIGEVEILKPPAKMCYAHVVPSGEKAVGDEGKKFEIQMMDASGQVLVKLKNFSVRAFTDAVPSKRIYFREAWEESARETHMETPGSILLIDNGEEMFHLLKHRGCEVTLVKPGGPEDYEALVESLKQKKGIPSKIIYMCPPGEFAPEEEYLRAQLEQGIASLFYLSRALVKRKPKEGIRLLYAYSSCQPQNAAVGGFARALRLENPKFEYTTIELPGLPGEKSADLLMRELEGGIGNETEIRYAGDKRLIKRMEVFEPAKVTQNPLPLKANGVYLITGGTGGLGMIFAEYLARQGKAKLILTGRSDVSPGKQRAIERLIRLGAEVIYVSGDISRRRDVDEIISKAKSAFGGINGIIHCAGVIRDAFLHKKTGNEMEEVLAPKVYGTVWLDEATKDEPLDFFVLFSSIAAEVGSMGQCDYAYANSFMDNYAKLRAKAERPGKTLSMGWPLWQDGGMKVDRETEALLAKTLGMKPLDTGAGLEIFTEGLMQPESRLMAIEGDESKIRHRLNEPAGDVPPPDTGSGGLLHKIQSDLVKWASGILRTGDKGIDPGAGMDEAGFDSILFTEFSNLLNEKYTLEIMPSVFFEHATLGSFAKYLAQAYGDKLDEYYRNNREERNTGIETETREKPRFLPGTAAGKSSGGGSAAEPIAIIGMSGVMPQSEDLEIFWKHLEEAKDLITEIPNDRWDWRAYYGDPSKEPNKTGVKWGGFMNEVDKFDASFFGISPREAELMDPQQRIFMETVWKTIEDAAYKPSRLSGTKTGVFVGVGAWDYNDLLKENGVEVQAQTSLGLCHALLANRISYLLNLRGPSEVLDTACSSSLVAVHRAVEAIRSGECEMAITGGIHVIASPTLYISFNKAGMLCEDGRCKTFDKGANGYVRGEGAGAILLKPLGRARADGDHIYAVIKGNAVNHGGRANSLTAPNPNAQAEVIADAWRKAGVDPSTISYIEAHGTGTGLGDPVEINGLKKAFQQLYRDWNKPELVKAGCGIGSVKTNIGHLEIAAGIAGLIKVVLAMKYKKLPASIHLEELNPYIQLEDGPFYIVNKTIPWERVTEAGESVPRRAGVSSFGFGGVNAHIALEEYDNSIPQRDGRSREPQAILLSAKNEGRLKAYARKLADFLEASHADIKDIAHTLQVGREAMEERLAVIADSRDQLVERLQDFIKGGPAPEGIFHGNIKQGRFAADFFEDEDAKEMFNRWVEKRKLPKLAELWVNGVDPDWWTVCGNNSGRRIPLPAYPFERERYWIPRKAGMKPAGGDRLHPFIDGVDLGLSLNRGIVFRKTMRSFDLIVKEHKVLGQPIFPGVGYLETAYAAAARIKENTGFSLQGVVWLQPFSMQEERKEFLTAIKEENGRLQYEIQSSENGKDVIHSRGTISTYAPPTESIRVSIEDIQSRCAYHIGKETIYRHFKERGVYHGPYLQGLEHLWGNDGEALGYLSMPSGVERELALYTLHPSLMDSAIQTAIAGFIARPGLKNRQPFLPFAVEKVEVLRPLQAHGYAYVRPAGKDIFDITILDEAGFVCVKLHELSIRELKASPQNLFYIPAWRPAELPAGQDRKNETVLVVYPRQGQALQKALAEACYGNNVTGVELNTRDFSNIEHYLQEVGTLHSVYFLGGIQPAGIGMDDPDVLDKSQEEGVLSLFWLVKALCGHGYGRRPLRLKIVTNNVCRVLPGETVTPWSGSLHGLSKTIAREFSGWEISCTDIDLENTDEEAIAHAARLLVSEPGSPKGDEAAVRHGQRYVRTVEPVSLPTVPDSSPFRQKGVYMILGGAGGIGLELSLHLAETAQARLVLIGRSELDPAQKEKISRIEAAGGKVLYIRGDAADKEGMVKAVEKAKLHFGRIHGVIHSAMVLKDKTLENMSEDAFRSVLAPKVRGSVILHSVLQGEELDFMMFFSSIQSFGGAAGQGNYAAACAFEDAFAHYLGSTGDYPVKIINWGYWGSVGVVAGEEYNRRMAAQGLHSISPVEGMRAIREVLGSSLDQVVAIKGEEDSLCKLGIDFSRRIEMNPASEFPGLKAIMGRAGLPAIEPEMLQKSQQAFEELEKFTHDLLMNAFREMGIFLRAGECCDRADLKERLKIAPRHSRLFEALLGILAKAGYIRAEGGRITATGALDNELPDLEEKKERLYGDFPEIRAFINLLWTCMERYPEILTGHIPATDILFPNSSVELVEGVYKGSDATTCYNHLVARSIKAFIRAKLPLLAPGEKVKILEIGAGTGATSAVVLDAIREYGQRLHYVYTDVSAAFTKYGMQKYGRENPFVEFKTLDIENEIAEQGYVPGDFDLVIAANVLHATRKIRHTLQNVKGLLKSKGWLIINELTTASDTPTATFGLLEGWWLFEDEEIRLKDSPLLGADTWERIFKEEGFGAVAILDRPDASRRLPGQSVIIAESDGLVRKKLRLEKKEGAKTPIPVQVLPPSPPAVRKEAAGEQAVREKILDILSAVLQIEKKEFCFDSPFAGYGVDSILAIEIIDKLNKELGISLKSTDLFSYSTVEKLTGHIVGGSGYRADSEVSVPKPASNKDRDMMQMLKRLEEGELDIDEVENCLQGWEAHEG